MRTEQSRVRGLGSAKEGVAHWWAQRLTAVALIPLVIWYVISLISLIGADRDRIVEWIHSPFVAICSLLLIGAVLYHGSLGMQVVIEDYVHGSRTKTVLQVLNKFAAVVLGVIAAFAVLKIAFA
jgi:succinate dehydrogenase / fumarate reductase membrane anchor subunit